MVTELIGVQCGMKSYDWFQNQFSLVWNHKYDFRPKLHDMKFNYHFIAAILKSQNSVSTNTLLVKWAVCWKAETKRLLHLILYSKQKWHNIEQKWCNLRQKLSDLEHEWRDLE